METVYDSDLDKKNVDPSNQNVFDDKGGLKEAKEKKLKEEKEKTLREEKDRIEFEKKNNKKGITVVASSRDEVIIEIDKTEIHEKEKELNDKQKALNDKEQRLKELENRVNIDRNRLEEEKMLFKKEKKLFKEEMEKHRKLAAITGKSTYIDNKNSKSRNEHARKMATKSGIRDMVKEKEREIEVERMNLENLKRDISHRRQLRKVGTTRDKQKVDNFVSWLTNGDGENCKSYLFDSDSD